jgi:hypothetical protein
MSHGGRLGNGDCETSVFFLQNSAKPECWSVSMKECEKKEKIVKKYCTLLVAYIAQNSAV